MMRDTTNETCLSHRPLPDMKSALLDLLLLLTRNRFHREQADIDDPRRDVVIPLTVDGFNVLYEGKVIHEAPSYEEAVLYRDRHIDAYM
ncbi:hypothetical protein V4C53_16875 [Paraburkholderia azotifigens]|uniref:hypothetical protein n=1 Tax=Paraburkholderia azotifigens TaxID=2057004 RepID=UPI00317C4E75